jgi:hypothetical protein
MSLGNFDERVHFIPLISPVDTAAVTKTTDEVDAGEAQWLQFYVFFGTITDDTVVVTVEKCTTTAGAGNTPIAFSYRYSAAAGTDTMGAIAAATTAGVTVPVNADDKCLIIDINPADVASGGPYVRVVADPGSSASAVEIAIWAMVWPRYPQNVVQSLLD